ncbi:MAG: sensor histidine kinase [Gemmatimonadaceae bacterium]|nr:sensor histidine kinase [Gemmatimonadaceae bacterium]
MSLLFALGGIFAIDRALAEANRSRVQIQAVESAARVESFLAMHAQALQSVRGLYLDPTHEVTEEQFESLLRSLQQYAPSFRRVWITDSTGRIRFQDLLGLEGAPLPPGTNVDTVRQQPFHDVIQRAVATKKTQISAVGRLGSGERGILMVQPLFIGERFIGFAGGTLTSKSILEFVEQQEPQLHGQLVIIAASDTVTGTSSPMTHRRLPVDSASTSIRIPGGGSWRLLAVQQVTDQSVRFLLWGVGLATLGTLLIGLLHERRQGLRLAERSAELERLSTELLRANRVKSEFLANVSHELRTPLNAIVGFVELLRDGVYGELNTRQSGPVERIASSANHLRQLVDQILDLAKIAAGRLDVQWEVIELKAFIVDLTSEIEALRAECGLTLSISISTSLPRVRTDPMHLRQIVLNLLGNALKFTPIGGIAVRARMVDVANESGGGGVNASAAHTPLSGTWIALEVADTGVGIARNDQERIFEEFEQVNAGPRTDSMQRGTGLGLPISRRLARLLGGELTVVSDLGKGATFTVWLPLPGQPKGSGVFSAERAGRNTAEMQAGQL